VPNNYLQHGLHNEKAALHLHQSNQFNDWTVTTAFYAALQFVKHKMFPMQIAGITYNSFDLYAQTITNRSKHGIVKDLLQRHHRAIAGRYNNLFRKCHTARYVNYQITDTEAQQAIELLAEIKQYYIG